MAPSTEKNMNYFLNKERQRNLIQSLVELSMPEFMARQFASFKDNIEAIDVKLAACANQASHYAERLETLDPSNEDDANEGGILCRFIKADIAIIEAYKDEAKSRGVLTKGNFTRFLQAAIAGLETTDRVIAKFIGPQSTIH